MSYLNDVNTMDWDLIQRGGGGEVAILSASNQGREVSQHSVYIRGGGGGGS